MWKVADESNMFVGCNPESNFPVSIELQFGGRLGTQEYLDNNHGMWFGVEDANRLILQLAQAIETVRAAEHSVEPTGGNVRPILEDTPGSDNPGVVVFKPTTSG